MSKGRKGERKGKKEKKGRGKGRRDRPPALLANSWIRPADDRNGGLTHTDG